MDISNIDRVAVKITSVEEEPNVTFLLTNPTLDPLDPNYEIGTIVINKNRSVDFLRALKVMAQEVVGDFNEFEPHYKYSTLLHNVDENNAAGEMTIVPPEGL